MVKHCLFYDLGMHHIIVEVSEEDFFKVIYDLSNEFEIVKKQNATDLEYCIVNYYSDLQCIGFIFEKS